MTDCIWRSRVRTYLFLLINRMKADELYAGQSIHIQYPRKMILGQYVLLGDRLKVYGKCKANIGDFVYFPQKNVTLLTSGHEIDNMDMLALDINIGE